MFSDITKERYKNFKKIRRAHYSLWILGGAFFLSLFGELFVNDRPIYLHYEGRSYFPALFFYPETRFGGKYNTEPDYKKLNREEIFLKNGGFMLFPIFPHDPLHHYMDAEGSPPHPPSKKHLLGTDAGARDILARLIYGFRISMIFALSLVLISAFLGIVIGGIQGYAGGKTDILIQRLIEVWSSLPFLYVVMLMGSVFGRSFFILLLVLSIFSWIGLSYYMRGEFLKIKNMTFVRAAKALGVGNTRIFFRHILPNSLTPVITILPFTLMNGIGSLTALDFLGFGLPPPTPSWGELLKQGLDNLYAPWIAISTTIALFITLLLATFIGEGVREAFDPRQNQRLE